MTQDVLVIEKSQHLHGTLPLHGAKNAVLVIMASLLLTSGVSKLSNIPWSHDVFQMISLLQELGVRVTVNTQDHSASFDTSCVNLYRVSAAIMKKMRASILVMGPLLARFGRAEVALPGGCILGARPIDFHLKIFSHMGAAISFDGDFLNAHAPALRACRFVLAYPSVGATENAIMAATLIPGITTLINAAIEPEVIDLVSVLNAMGARIELLPAGTIRIEGVSSLKPVDHAIIMDRLEAGTLLTAVAATGGSLHLPFAPASSMDVFLDKLAEMGHSISVHGTGLGISFTATASPKAVSFKTMPYPGFPTDLQAQMMALQATADGVSVIEETVFENRMLHVRELQKMGAQIDVVGTTATVKGVDTLYGASVIATDIRASAALVVAGLRAEGTTVMTGISHVQRGYEDLVGSLRILGASVMIRSL